MPLLRPIQSSREYILLLGEVSEISQFFLILIFLNRILFPYMSDCDSSVSNLGFSRIHGDDPDDYVDIESGKHPK